MCIDGKTQALAKRLRPHVLDKIDNVDEAREMIAENVSTANSQVARMAELFYENTAQFGIVRQVAQVKSHPATKLSAVRGAIVLVLQEYVDAHERDELRSLHAGTGRQFSGVLA